MHRHPTIILCNSWHPSNPWLYKSQPIAISQFYYYLCLYKENHVHFFISHVGVCVQKNILSFIFISFQFILTIELSLVDKQKAKGGYDSSHMIFVSPKFTHFFVTFSIVSDSMNYFFFIQMFHVFNSFADHLVDTHINQSTFIW